MSDIQFELKLKVFWFKNVLGLAIDQVNLNQKYPLTNYYFWPKTEAWEQLKLELDSKLWLTKKEKEQILQTTGDVMKYWLSYRNTKTVENLKEEFKEIVWLAEQKVWNELAKVFPKFKRRLPWGPSKESLEEAGITMWTQDERLRAAQQRYKRPRRSSGAGSSSEAVETFEIRDHGNPNENYKVGGPRNPPNATVSLYQARMDHFIFAMLLEYNTITNEQFRKLVEEAEEKLKKDNEVERFFQIHQYTGNQPIKYLRDNKEPDARFEILKRRYLKISEER